MEKRRCFIALDLPDKLIQECLLVQDILREKALFKGKFTEPNNIHLTLKFLGSISNDEIQNVIHGLDKISFNNLYARINSIGVFNPSCIRIVWIHLEGPEKLQAKIDESVCENFAKEKRFMSHITIARVKELIDRKKFMETVNNIKIRKSSAIIESFSLYESTLTPRGPTYERIRRFLL